MQIKVSVIIPVFNAAEHLRQCLDSVLHQTLREIEIICVDDGSTDGSLEILQEYATGDMRVRLMQHPGTQISGGSGAINKGLQAACGEYVIILNDDDFFDLNMLEKTYQKAVQVNADLVVFDAFAYDNVTKTVRQKRHLAHKYLPGKEVFSWSDFPDYIFQAVGNCTWLRLVRNQFLKDNGLHVLDNLRGDDIYYSCTVDASAKRITVVNEQLVYYRVNNAESITGSAQSGPLREIGAAMAVRRWLDEKGLYSALRKSFINMAVWLCKYCLDGRNYCRDAFCEAYELLQEALAGLGVLDLQEEDFYDPEYYSWSRKVITTSAKEAWRLVFVERMEQLAARDPAYPLEITTGDRVVLYGAGGLGRACFLRNLVQRHCNIVLWVDRNYQTLGNLAGNPERILHTEYDKILVAIDRLDVYQEIKETMLGLHVPEEKIIWINKDVKED